MPRSNIIRSNRPGLMIPRRNGPAIRTPTIIPEEPSLSNKISWVPPISLSGAVRHLTYHIWATKHHDMWKWNVDQLSRRWSLFNGKKCVGIVYDEQSHDSDTVLNYCRSLGMNWDFVFTAPNDPSKGELITWHEKMDFLMPEYATQDEVVFYAHAKGVKYPNMDDVLPWTQFLYEVNLDNWPVVQRSLETHAIVGAMKLGGYRYAGTFYWFRLMWAGGGRYQDIYQGTCGPEDWPSRHFRWNCAACLYGDQTIITKLDSVKRPSPDGHHGFQNLNLILQDWYDAGFPRYVSRE